MTFKADSRNLEGENDQAIFEQNGERELKEKNQFLEQESADDMMDNGDMGQESSTEESADDINQDVSIDRDNMESAEGNEESVDVNEDEESAESNEESADINEDEESAEGNEESVDINEDIG